MNKHFNTYIHKIIEVIKKEDKKFSFAEVESKSGVKITNLISILKNNPKISVENNFIKYVPEYNIKTKQDVIDLLKNEGIEMDKLCDNFLDVRNIMDIKEDRPQQVGVRKRAKVVLPPIVTDDFILLRDLDGQEIAFKNHKFENLPQEDEDLDKIKALYNSIPIPNHQNVCEYLNDIGSKTQTQVTKKKVPTNTLKKKKQKRRIKITNTHVEGLDLNNMDEDDD